MKRKKFKTFYELAEYFSVLLESESKESQAQLQLSGENSVKIMTVHASKGLQFPILFLPDLKQNDNKIDMMSISVEEYNKMKIEMKQLRLEIAELKQLKK